MNAFSVVASLIFIIVYLLYTLTKRKYNYWKNKNVPHLKPLPLLGNYANYLLQKEYIGIVVQKLCQRFPDAPYFGAYYGTEPVLVVKSPEVLKHVLTKDFYYFNGREASDHSHKEMVTQNLFFASGDKWKVVRQNLTPLFSSAKMKNMFYLIEKCCYLWEDLLDRETSMSDVIEARGLSARFTIDCICTCAFGVEGNTMNKPENNPFQFMAYEIFESTNSRGVKMNLRAIWPSVFYKLGYNLFPPTINDFFSQLLKGVYESRNHEPSARNDFIDLLLNLRKDDVITCESMKSAKSGAGEKVVMKLEDDLLTAQSVVFFGAGFETSATTMSFTLYELAKNQEVQRRAIEEVDEFLRRHNNKMNYEVVNELPYLESCMYETIRMYPVLGNLTREVMENYTFPDGLKVEKGVRIHIPVYHLHHNPDYFPEPEVYNPERFLPENKDKIKQNTFLPYGEGPRVCMGKRFSKMQVLAGLVSFLKKYTIELAEGMPKTVVLESRSFLIMPRDQGLNLKVTVRDGWENRMLVRT